MLRAKILAAVASTLLSCFVLYAGSVLLRSYWLFDWARSLGNRSPAAGEIYRPDPELGYVPRPNVEMIQHVPGRPVSVRFDSSGFRVPPGVADSGSGPVVLFLGDSFTFGAAAEADESFPTLAARLVGGTGLNAAVGGYGLAQVLVRARRLIPALRPDLVVVQYSPWLVSRAQRLFAPAAFGTVPAPYFVDSADGLRLEPPAFASPNFDVPISEYARSRETRFPGFVWDVGLPLFSRSDWSRAWLGARVAIGWQASPVQDSERIIRATYSQIADLARDHGARMLIVVLRLGCGETAADEVAGIVGARVVNAHAILCLRLGGGNWDRAYSFWAGQPPKVVNRHPNPAAHRIIAEQLARVMRTD